MVDVTVTEENIGVDRAAPLHQPVAERPDAGAAVEDEKAVAAANFDARGVAAVADRIRAGTGDASPDAPKPDAQTIVHAQRPQLRGSIPLPEPLLSLIGPARPVSFFRRSSASRQCGEAHAAAAIWCRTHRRRPSRREGRSSEIR